MYRFLVALVDPYKLTLLVLVVSTAVLWRKPRPRPRWLVVLTVAVGLLVLISLPPVGYLAMGTLEWPYPPVEETPEQVDAIVVLGGWVRVHDAEKHVELAADTAFRCLHARRLYHESGGCPVILCGGKVVPGRPGPTLARAMQDFLVEAGVDPGDLVLEDASTTTYENAANAAPLLEGLGARRIVLVTDASHMLRASGCFRGRGLDVVPAPCNYRATRFEWSPVNFLPSASAAGGVGIALHEWLGVAWYWLRGRF
jgi:uncharacterized SAM-binding protein YcdF (DUF218 family)